MGGLLALFGDALLSQDLAQPGMLVVHVWFPSAVLIKETNPGRLIATSGTRSGCRVARWAAGRVR
jgi:hypothetical protein